MQYFFNEISAYHVKYQFPSMEYLQWPFPGYLSVCQYLYYIEHIQYILSTYSTSCPKRPAAISEDWMLLIQSGIVLSVRNQNQINIGNQGQIHHVHIGK